MVSLNFFLFTALQVLDALIIKQDQRSQPDAKIPNFHYLSPF